MVQSGLKELEIEGSRKREKGREFQSLEAIGPKELTNELL